MIKGRYRYLLWLIFIVVVAAIAITILPRPIKQIVLFALIWLNPIFLWAAFIEGDWLESHLLGAGITFAFNILLTLALFYLPGSIADYALLSAAIFPAVWLVIRRPNPITREIIPWKEILLIFLVASILRVPNIGYKEFQGDEGKVLQKAALSLEGDQTELFSHRKGPAEILTVMMSWGTAGDISESWVRLPFLWAGLLSVMAIYALGRRWFGQKVGLVTGLLFAIFGFSIAFSRIVQYQNLVLMFSLLALLSMSRYVDSVKNGDLFLTAIFLAMGLLSHYDALLFVPALVLMAIGTRKKLYDRIWFLATLAGLSIVALFYIPYILSPEFGNIHNYLVTERVGSGINLSNLGGGAIWRMLFFYNSSYFVIGLIIFILIALLFHRRELWVAYILFLVPLLFYQIVVDLPRTHFYTIFPGAILIASYGIVSLLRRLRKENHKTLAKVLWIPFVLWFLISAAYPLLFFTDVKAERQRRWSDNRMVLYPVTWDSHPPHGLFGFPYQAGWRVVSDLVGPATYRSNEEVGVTSLYMTNSVVTRCPMFNTFILAENVQDVNEFSEVWINERYLHYVVTVNDRETIKIYKTIPKETPEIITADKAQRWLTASEFAFPEYGGTYPVDVVLGEKVRLIGYDLDLSQAYPGGNLLISLYWQPLTKINSVHSSFVHLFDGQVRGQHDGIPDCEQSPTTEWTPGNIIYDPHLISISPDTPPGDIALLVGMYEWPSIRRLTVPNDRDNVVRLPGVTISEP
jgi:hypothetical protein